MAVVTMRRKKRGKKRKKGGRPLGISFLRLFQNASHILQVYRHSRRAQFTEQPQGADLGKRVRTKKNTILGAQHEFVTSKDTVNHLCSYKEPTLFLSGKESVGVYVYTFGIVL